MVMQIKRAGLTYVSVPKCACSSLKHFVHHVITGEPFPKPQKGVKKRTVHHAYPAHAFDEVPDNAEGLIALVREPVGRIVSCHTNKIDNQGGIRVVTDEALEARGLPRNPDLDVFVDNLNAYREVSPEIRRHTQPLSWALGTDPDRFEALFDFSEIDAFADFVNRRAGTTVTLGHYNRSKPATHPASDGVRQKIRDLFAEDFALFGRVFDKADTRRSAATHT
jgi:hypothetical protein